jgi:hypothetical protein
MAVDGFITAWQRHLQADERLGTLVQVGLTTSYPMFARVGDNLFVRHFYYPSSRTGPNEVTVSGPRLLVTLALPDLAFVESETNPFDLPPLENAVYEVPEEEHEAKRALIARLETLYDEALSNYPEPPPSAVANELVETLQQVVPPALWPYYEQLMRGFADWIEGE